MSLEYALKVEGGNKDLGFEDDSSVVVAEVNERAADVEDKDDDVILDGVGSFPAD